MAKGRKTGGRQKGSLNKKTREQIEAVTKSGITPLEYMLNVLRDENMPSERRDEMAKAAAPYVHPRLTSIDGSMNLNVFKHEEALDELDE